MTTTQTETIERFAFADGAEIHTTDLTDPCMRAVQLRHEGRIEREYTTALYRGQVAHAALEHIHRHDDWEDVGGAVRRGIVKVQREADEEDRPLSASVRENQADIAKEVKRNVGHYVERRREWFEKCQLIGVEVPIRWHTKLPGCGAVTFASHLDLIYRDPHGALTCEDWKWRDESPSMAYLGRNLQFGVYCLAIAYGEVRFDEHLDLWGTLGEFACFAWVDLKNFKPYTRKTTIIDNGEEVVFRKGDHRPIQNTVKSWTFDPDREDVIKRELAMRVVAMRYGIFPLNPDPIGCHICESKRYCPSFHGRERGM